MIKILNEGRGLTFHDWIDVYLQVPDDSIIGSYCCDLGHTDWEKPEEVYWMQWLRSYRGKLEGLYPENISIIQTQEVPHVIKEGRGIGAWWNPKYIIICDSVSSTSRLGQKRPWGGEREETEYGHPYWNDIPRFRRLRPFMENKRQLKFFFQLFSSCPSITPENSYVTSFWKHWTPSERHSIDLFLSEIHTVAEDSKIICLGQDLWTDIHSHSTVEMYCLPWPQFYSTWHGHGWRSYREKFCRLICSS